MHLLHYSVWYTVYSLLASWLFFPLLFLSIVTETFICITATGWKETEPASCLFNHIPLIYSITTAEHCCIAGSMGLHLALLFFRPRARPLDSSVFVLQHNTPRTDVTLPRRGQRPYATHHFTCACFSRIDFLEWPGDIYDTMRVLQRQK